VGSGNAQRGSLRRGEEHAALRKGERGRFVIEPLAA
jgi:hypothetical protein